MTISESVNRATNLIGTAIVGLAGAAFLPEFFLEDDLSAKIDDGLLFILGVIALIWYKTKKNSVKRSAAPVVFVVAALVIKIGAVLLEFSDKEDVGDDFGALILFVLSTIFVFILYKSAKKLLKD